MAPSPNPPRRSPGFAERPSYRIEFLPCPRRVRVLFGGETVADSSEVRVMREDGRIPVYYFPRADVRMELLRPTEHSTHCPFKGEASYWTLRAGERSSANAAWSYESPIQEIAELAGYIAFYRDAVDAWYEDAP